MLIVRLAAMRRNIGDGARRRHSAFSCGYSKADGRFIFAVALRSWRKIRRVRGVTSSVPACCDRHRSRRLAAVLAASARGWPRRISAEYAYEGVFNIGARVAPAAAADKDQISL